MPTKLIVPLLTEATFVRYVLDSVSGCRGQQGPKNTGATRWGEYGCDSPGDLVMSSFSTMGNLVGSMDNITFALFTGDVVSHDDDVEMSELYVMFEEQLVFDAFKAEMVNSRGKIVGHQSMKLMF